MEFGNILPIVPFILFGIAVLLLGWHAHVQEKKRLEALRAWAGANGYDWQPEQRDDPALPFELFRQGDNRFSHYHASREFAGAVAGWDPIRLMLFEYHYETKSRDSKGHTTKTSHRHGCAVIESGMELGVINLREEGIFDKLAEMLGFDDIDMEDPDFSRRFHLGARDRRDAYELIDGPMMEYLKTIEPGCMIATNGPLALIVAPRYHSAEGCAMLERTALGLLAHLPRRLVNAERERRGLKPLIDAGAAAKYHANDAREA